MVFPAYAGMFLPEVDSWLTTTRFPRIRGDVPSECEFVVQCFEFSPHTRGCSAWFRRLSRRICVFPAYAGMFRSGSYRKSPEPCFPRIRGDVPAAPIAARASTTFSPHTRGCSAGVAVVDAASLVFPAYAGMFLIDGTTVCTPNSFPRIRGDVPS